MLMRTRLDFWLTRGLYVLFRRRIWSIAIQAAGDQKGKIISINSTTEGSICEQVHRISCLDVAGGFHTCCYPSGSVEHMHRSRISR